MKKCLCVKYTPAIHIELHILHLRCLQNHHHIHSGVPEWMHINLQGKLAKQIWQKRVFKEGVQRDI